MTDPRPPDDEPDDRPPPEPPPKRSRAQWVAAALLPGALLVGALGAVSPILFRNPEVRDPAAIATGDPATARPAKPVLPGSDLFAFAAAAMLLPATGFAWGWAGDARRAAGWSESTGGTLAVAAAVGAVNVATWGGLAWAVAAAWPGPGSLAAMLAGFVLLAWCLHTAR